MRKGYFAAAWGDLTHSPGWFSKLLRITLLCLIPVFGIVVAQGYFYGWARDIAWNVHRPLPKRVLGNEDGTLYRRGFFLLVISFVVALALEVFNLLINLIVQAALSFTIPVLPMSGSLISVFLLSFLGVIGYFMARFFTYVGYMRTSLYTTLSSGFQLGKIWSMVRYDFLGLLRIFGMEVLVSLIGVIIVAAILFFVFSLGIILVPFLETFFSGAELFSMLGLVFLSIAFCLVLIIFMLFIAVFVCALVSRALGYWTRQFDVHLWGGQDDPMPFERYHVPPTGY